MKKTSKIMAVIILAVLFSCVACQRETMSEKTNGNRIIPIRTGDKPSIGYLMVVHLGHDGKNCPGCILWNGEWIHIDCQGMGNACEVASSVVLTQIGNAVTATTTDTFGLTNLSFFDMPSRSLNYEDEKGNHIYLNIPSQHLFRDNTTQQFTFTGLFYSETPAYSNN